MANSTIHAARNRSRVSRPHCSTWSTLERYFRLAARMTNPMTTFTRASQPPLLGRRFRYDGNSASRKNGSASPVANVTIPATGRAMPPPTEAASSVPTNGPTQANDASENVSPMSRVPANPPFSDDWFSRVRMDDGMVISNAPSRLKPKAMNNAAMKPLTQGLDAKLRHARRAPAMAVVTSPSPENSTMIPRQKTTACVTESRRLPECRLRKYDMVMGIIGNTQGVKMEASPNPNATSRKAHHPWSAGVLALAGGFGSAYPVGIATEAA